MTDTRTDTRTRTVTVGWTKSEYERDERGRVVAVTYSSFDGYREGADQHTETIALDLCESVTGEQVCDLMFRATNDPYAESVPVLAPIAAALHANGYRGQGAHWSLSVGDTVTVDGVMFACVSFGWERLA